MRIMFLASAASVHSQKWVNFFVEQGHEVTWLSLHAANCEILPTINFYQFPISNNPFNLFLAAIKALNVARFCKPEIIHVHSLGTYGFVSLLLTKFCLVLTPWGSDVLLNGKNLLKRTMMKFLIKQSKLITCDAAHMMREVSAISDFQCNVHRINFGVDIERYRKLEIVRIDSLPSEVKRHVNREGFKVISTRNLYDIYDVQCLVAAFSTLKKKCTDASLFIAGTGPALPKLKEQVSKAGLGNEVVFLGSIPQFELNNVLNVMDVYVSTSKSDAGLASSTAEAMACELPVVITDVHDNAEWIDDGVSGFLFKPGDPDALAGILLEVSEVARVKRKEIGIKARQHIARNNNLIFEMRKMEKLLLNLVDTELNSRKPN
ncbi:glycosyltransferase [Alphaproteobacteria bacterium]|nr:glycosyltransferase [Alphaproteobacteria bacterium]